MTYMSLYAGYCASYDAEVLRTTKAYGLFECNLFACATMVTPVTVVTHPCFILLLLCIVGRCQKFFSNNQSPSCPPNQECRENYLLSQPMNCITLYGGYCASCDAEVLRT